MAKGDYSVKIKKPYQDKVYLPKINGVSSTAYGLKLTRSEADEIGERETKKEVDLLLKADFGNEAALVSTAA